MSGTNSEKIQEQIMKASILMMNKHAIAGLELFKEIFKTDPDNDFAWYQLGGGLIFNNDPVGAAYCNKRAYQINPQNMRALGDLAFQMLRIGKPETALEYYKQLMSIIIDSAPSNALSLIWHRIQYVYESLGITRGSWEEFKRLFMEDVQKLKRNKL